MGSNNYDHKGQSLKEPTNNTDLKTDFKKSFNNVWRRHFLYWFADY